MSRISPKLLDRLRSYQTAPDVDAPPAATLPKGVTFNKLLQRYYAKRNRRFVGAFTYLDDATKAARGELTGLALLEAMQR